MIDSEASRRLEQAVLDVAQEIRNELADNNLHHMAFDIQVRGPVHGELRVSYNIGQHVAATVEADGVQVMLDEYLHRHGFEKRHNNLRLTYTGETKRET